MGKLGLVLGGGGSRGAYEIGVWTAARELGISFDVITGTSIGALNGALIVNDDYDFAVDMWRNMSYEAVMSNVHTDDLTTLDGAGRVFRSALREIVAEGGMEIGPLETLVREHLHEDVIRRSPIAFGMVTVELPNLRAAEMSKEDIPQGQMADYLLASAACYPAFKPRTIGGSKFVDGGYRDNLPIDLALELGADEIWAVDLNALGHTPEKLMYDVPVRYIRSYWDLGVFLTFSPERIERNMALGYLDTMKSLGELEGFAYTFKPGEIDCNYRQLLEPMDLLRRRMQGEDGRITPLGGLMQMRMSAALRWGKRRKNNPRYDLLRQMELAAELLDIDPTVVYTAQQMNEAILEGYHQGNAITRTEIEETLKKANSNLPSVVEVAARIAQTEKGELLAYAYDCIDDLMQGLKTPNALQLSASVLPREFAAAMYVYLLKHPELGQRG